MNLLLLGVNHRTAGLDDRETLAFTPEETLTMLGGIVRSGLASEAALLSTCNRTEFYVAAPNVAAAEAAVREAVVQARGRDLLAPGPHRLHETGADVVTHLLRVACALDSMVLGDVQILGQVKDAYQLARRAGTAGAVLDRLFETGLRTGKRARSETTIGVGTVSVSSAAVSLAAHGPVAQAHGHAAQVHGHAVCPRHATFNHGLAGRHLVIVGAGSTARLAALHATQHRPASVTIVNRGVERGATLAAEIGGTCVGLDQLPAVLVNADVVFTATRATTPVITADMVATAVASRPDRPLVLFDMAVPRDIESAAGLHPGVTLHAIDGIRSVVDAHVAERTSQVPAVERIVGEEAEKFGAWARGLGATSTVVALRDHFERIRIEELGRLPATASDEERSRADRLTRALINRLLHTPTLSLKDADPASDDGRGRLQAARELFALGPKAAARVGRRDA